jgi:hypothetical protein
MSADGGRPELDGLSDLQRRGATAAGEVFERFIARLEVPDQRSPRPAYGRERGNGAAAASPATLAQARAAVARAIDLYAELFQETFDLYADLVEQGARPPGVGVTAADGTGSPVTLAGLPGQRAVAPVWIHNATEAPVTGVTLRITGLTASDGAGIGASSGSFTPARLDVAAGSSGSARLSVTIPPAAAPTIYHGLVLASSLPWASLAVRLVVQP